MESTCHLKPGKDSPLSMFFHHSHFLKDNISDVAFVSDVCPPPEVFVRGTQREYSSKPLKHSIVKRILVVKR